MVSETSAQAHQNSSLTAHSGTDDVPGEWYDFWYQLHHYVDDSWILDTSISDPLLKNNKGNKKGNSKANKSSKSKAQRSRLTWQSLYKSLCFELDISPAFSTNTFSCDVFWSNYILKFEKELGFLTAFAGSALALSANFSANDVPSRNLVDKEIADDKKSKADANNKKNKDKKEHKKEDKKDEKEGKPDESGQNLETEKEANIEVYEPQSKRLKETLNLEQKTLAYRAKQKYGLDLRFNVPEIQNLHLKGLWLLAVSVSQSHVEAWQRLRLYFHKSDVELVERYIHIEASPASYRNLRRFWIFVEAVLNAQNSNTAAVKAQV